MSWFAYVCGSLYVFFELGSNCPVGQHGMHLSLKVDLGAKLF